MDEGKEAPKAPDVLLDEAVDEFTNIAQTRKLGFEAAKKRTEISGEFTPQVASLVNMGIKMGAAEETIHWIDGVFESGIIEPGILDIIKNRTIFASQERESNDPHLSEPMPVNENLRMRIQDQMGTVKGSQIRFEQAKQELESSGRITPELEKLLKLAEDSSRNQASLDMLLSLVEANVPDIQSGLVQEIFDEKQRTFDETEAFVADQSRNKPKGQ